jgi:hypothetical protein
VRATSNPEKINVNATHIQYHYADYAQADGNFAALRVCFFVSWSFLVKAAAHTQRAEHSS